MDFDFTEEQEELRRAVGEVLERECPIALARSRVEDGAIPEQPWRSAGELGWTAVAIPERFGGLGLGFEELGLVIEAHGHALAPGPFLATLSQFLPLVRELGTDAQQEHLLSRIAEGQLSGALASGNVSGLGLLPDDSLRARPDGDGFVLEGTRYFVIDGDSADQVAAVARFDSGDGFAAFLLPKGAAKSERITGLDETRPVVNLRFDSLSVGPEQILGEPGAIREGLERALDEATVALALETVGACQRILELVLSHARSRRQFGQPIGAFQAIQHKCADMFIALEKARSVAYFAMMTVAERDPGRALATSMAKASAGDCQRLLCKEGIQIHGGTGFTWENDIHLLVKRAKAGGLLLGTTAEHRARVAQILEL